MARVTTQAQIAPMCLVPYERPTVIGGGIYRCQYLAGHPSDRHSWYTLKTTDDVSLEALAAPVETDPTPYTVQQVLDAITAGELDEYIEAILSVAHTRKRVRSNRRGFHEGATSIRVVD